MKGGGGVVPGFALFSQDYTVGPFLEGGVEAVGDQRR